MDSQPARKKRKLGTDVYQTSVNSSDVQSSQAVTSLTPDASPYLIAKVASTTDGHSNITSLSRSISPPARRIPRAPDVVETSRLSGLPSVDQDQSMPNKSSNSSILNMVSSPVHLSRVQELAASNNIDTVSLEDILGDPLIKECWAFNYLFDVDFLMSNFDEDVRDLIRVKVVHGSWKKEDSNRTYIDDAAKRYKNVQVLTAYMPEAFGTHHSKMFVLFRHDDLAQVIIHTANIVAGDWRMCQAIWRSPLLPLMTAAPAHADVDASSTLPPIGTGLRFKHDLLSYLRAYGQAKTGPLTSQLKLHDFSSIRAALIASTPSKLNLLSSDPATETLWGWPGLNNILKAIPTKTNATQIPHIVMQVSSVATLGQTDKWLTNTFLSTLRTTSTPQTPSNPPAKASLVFPTADEIRRSLDGYSAGSSIHMKTQSPAQAKQLAYLRPLLYHWAGDHDSLPSSSSTSAQPIRQAGRRRAAPHIKTYIRFRDAGLTTIDWAMMTSANLSTQAWGAAANAAGEVRVCSYEVGVVVWPALWDEAAEGSAEMVPVFGRDMPKEEGEKGGAGDGNGAGSGVESGNGSGSGQEGEKEGARVGSVVKTRVGWRMPYDLPLVPYAKEEMPWCATEPCEELDWMGRKWPGFWAR